MKKSIFILTSLVLLLTFSIMAQPKVIVTDMPRSLSDGLNNLTDQIAQGLTENQKRRIAVVEFVDLKGNVSDLGRYLSEKLITRLFQSKRFTVIERQQLNKIIAEQKFSLTGIIDPSSAQKLGKLLGVDSIATGSVTSLGKSVEINARLISTETGEVFSAASVEITKDDAVCTLMGDCGLNAGIAEKTDPLKSRSEVPKPLRQVGKNFVFELQTCSRRETTVICELDVTNIDRDRSLTLSTSYSNQGVSKAIDQFGSEHKAAAMELGGSSKRSLANTSMLKDVPVKARIYFENVGPNVSKFNIVQLIANDSPMGFFNVQFRDVPVIVSGSRATSVPTPPRGEWVYHGNYFTVRLKQCRASGSSVICAFTTTNNDKEDRDFALVGSAWGNSESKLYDNLGNTTGCNQAEVANSGRKNDAGVDVMSGLSVPVTLYCQDVNLKAASIAKLAMQICSRGGCNRIEYRDIPIDR